MSGIVPRLRFLIGRRLRRLRARLASVAQQRRLARLTLHGSSIESISGSTDPRTAGASGGAEAPDGGTLAVLAHQDDDLLFQSTALHDDIRTGRRLRSVYLTAGDDDEGSWYWKAREAGVRAAYALMADVADVWSVHVEQVAGRPVNIATLAAEPRISLVFVRLPDGGLLGEGGRRSGGGSLQKLYEGRIASLTTVDFAATHTLASLQQTVQTLIERFRPDRLTTLDHLGAFGDGDHSDHHAAAFLTARVSAELQGGLPHGLVGYRGYPIEESPANLDAAAVADKKAAFYRYAESDHKTCASDAAAAGRPEAAWLLREYEATAVATPREHS